MASIIAMNVIKNYFGLKVIKWKFFYLVNKVQWPLPGQKELVFFKKKVAIGFWVIVDMKSYEVFMIY